MIKVAVKNFQSIAKANIEINGFTVVTGKNNSGKSALLRSINSLFTNALGSSFVRNGEDYCEVSLDFNNGETVTWQKGEKIKPTYWINGGEPIYCGRNAPEELEQFNVVPLKVAGREIWPQIAPQFTGQVFLIDLPGSVMAEMVADVDRVGELNSALKNCEKDKRANNSKLKIRNEDHQSLIKEREKYADLSLSEKSLGELTAIRQELQSLRDKINNYEALRERRKIWSQKVNSLSTIQSHFSAEKSLRLEQNDLVEIDQKATKLSKLARQFNKYERECRLLKNVRDLSVPSVEPLKEIRAKLKPIKPLIERRNLANAIVQSLDTIDQTKIPSANELAELMKRLKTLNTLREQRNDLTEKVAILSSLPKSDHLQAPPTNQRLDQLLNIKESHLRSKKSVYTIESNVQNTQSELTKISDYISQTLNEHGECPYCGGDT